MIVIRRDSRLGKRLAAHGRPLTVGDPMACPASDGDESARPTRLPTYWRALSVAPKRLWRPHKVKQEPLL